MGQFRGDGKMKQRIVKGYRFVTDDLKSEHGETQWVIGEWQKLNNTTPLELCSNGFHASKNALDSLGYVFGSRWFHCEARGKILRDSDKFCATEMRITKEIPELLLRTFAYECALHVLSIYEKYYPKDKRVRECLEAMKRYLDAPTDEHKQEMAAARDAAWAAERKWQQKRLNQLLRNLK
jgi:hypothetical protein